MTNIGLITNKETSVSIHDLINRKEWEQIFNPSQNFIKYDLEYLGITEQNQIIASGSYYCPECKTSHFKADKTKLNRITKLIRKLS